MNGRRASPPAECLKRSGMPSTRWGCLRKCQHIRAYFAAESAHAENHTAQPASLHHHQSGSRLPIESVPQEYLCFTELRTSMLQPLRRLLDVFRKRKHSISESLKPQKTSTH